VAASFVVKHCKLVCYNYLKQITSRVIGLCDSKLEPPVCVILSLKVSNLCIFSVVCAKTQTITNSRHV
jgi:hypothetical protein